MKRGLANLSRVIASNGFFKAILIIFVLQAIWIAISAGYPQPFDENTHFGLIQLYSHHWLPFISEPTTANTFGVVSRDPSYLYHYLLSFPYRLSAHFLRNVDEQILFMRLFSIAFFAWGLVLFRKLLGYCKVSDGVLNASLLFFVLIPVVPLLAGQLNYDNLLMLLTPAVLLAAVRFTERLKAGEFNLSGLCICLALGLLASITQIDFLPIFVGIIVWV
ncbi:MAG TPA: hypothetical protein VG964_03425, partial [Candidatus Saccharimonadales bacterium]|nr:hypothetical protein [Candidatus Saccharimonadales bacterium]